MSDISTQIIPENKPIKIQNSIEAVTNTKRIKLSSNVLVHEGRELLYAMTYVDKWINCFEKLASKDSS